MVTLAASFNELETHMQPADTVEFEAVNVEAVRRASEANEPIRRTFANGVVFEELRAGTGAFRKYDPRSGTTMTHSQEIIYRPTLGEQYLKSRA